MKAQILFLLFMLKCLESNTILRVIGLWWNCQSDFIWLRDTPLPAIDYIFVISVRKDFDTPFTWNSSSVPRFDESGVRYVYRDEFRDSPFRLEAFEIDAGSDRLSEFFAMNFTYDEVTRLLFRLRMEGRRRMQMQFLGH